MQQAPKVSPPLLKWYDKYRRVLPWRALPGQKPNPYAVWLSEVMLQQTTVATVGPYYHAFLKRWPKVSDLAKAERDDVMSEWAGLGYYSRARNLYACAQAVVANHKGKFPETEAELLALPGIGPYTAAAIAAIAFDHSTNVVDGNVERVISRLYRVQTPMPLGKAEIKQLAAAQVPAKRGGDYAQALMDLGATICTPRSPDCPNCPLKKICQGYAEGDAAQYPKTSPKKARPIRYATVFVLQDKDGRYWMRQRPEKGLLAAMLEFPSSPWQEKALDLPAALAGMGALLPAAQKWKILQPELRHVFTHFELRFTITCARAGKKPDGLWLTADEARSKALPSLMNKVLNQTETQMTRDITSAFTSV